MLKKGARVGFYQPALQWIAATTAVDDSTQTVGSSRSASGYAWSDERVCLYPTAYDEQVVSLVSVLQAEPLKSGPLTQPLRL